jgi:hypothetical protein
LSASWELELLPPQGAVATVLTPQSPYSLPPTTAQRHSSLNSAVARKKKKKKEKKDITIETVENKLFVMYLAIQSSHLVNLGKRK